MTGYVVAGWSLQDFLAHLTLEVVGWLAFASLTTVAVFAVPIVAYLRISLRTPLAGLGLVLIGSATLAVVQGIPLESMWGLGLYVLLFAPVYFVVYLAVGAVEYVVRT